MCTKYFLISSHVALSSGGGVESTWGSKTFVPPAFRRVRGRGGVTYVLLEGCHKRLGCTLVRSWDFFRGPSRRKRRGQKVAHATPTLIFNVAVACVRAPRELCGSENTRCKPMHPPRFVSFPYRETKKCSNVPGAFALTGQSRIRRLSWGSWDG